MAARFPLPNGAIVEIAMTLGTAIPFTAISNAAPPVLTAEDHGLDTQDVVLIDSGWAKLTDRAARVANALTDSFALGGVSTADVDTFTPGAGLGSVIPVTDWVQISKVTGFTPSGGEQQFLTVGYLEDDDDRQMPTNRNPISLAIVVEDQPTAAYVGAVEGFDETKELTVVRLKLRNGDQILYPGYVSITTTPTMERNNLMTRTISVGLSGRPLRYLKAA
ncbi:phage tail protein [Pseudomonas sp. S12(2018)]|uniref:phage tail protein n=1 Tax=Pseudomonas sp. S12(2018) TaxID=2219664 RepID=UPI0020CD21B7|nr:phage tail protein [Pseudomonas sp. S12(2018)]MCQ0168430.1 phage tail protein [Pseudomonas sp. S12(2018)]